MQPEKTAVREILDWNSKFFTVNAHWASQGGSLSIQREARPHVNGVVEGPQAQANVTAACTAEILAQHPHAYAISSGNFNEYSVSQPILDFISLSGMEKLDKVAGILVVGGYSYLYDMNTQNL